MRIKSVVIAVGAVLIGIGVIWAMTRGDSDRKQSGETAADPPEEGVIRIAEQKVQAAEITATPAARRTLQAIATVPGRLQYEDAHHVAVTASSDATVVKVCVQHGDAVEAGDLLTVINSPEIGYARADVLRHRSSVGVARAKREWEQAVCDGLENLVKAVNKGEDVAGILDNMSEVTLGSYRGDVLSAYSRYELAKKVSANTSAIAETGAIAGRVVEERNSERNAAEAELKAVTEQSLFEATQARATADLEATDAEQRLLVAEQHLETLLGYPEKLDPSQLPEPLSLVEIRSPLKGTVESKVFAQSERVHQGDEMFIIADTTTLWVAADVREKEWAALRLKPGQTFEVAVPALQDEALTATLEFVGRQVDPKTNAVPLIGTIGNKDGMLRPGQFVRVRLPVGPPRNALAVPNSAIVAHESQSFVFLRQGDTRFRRVDVKTGLEESDESGWTEITSGLKEGDQVVDHGAFALKSELLLEKEE